MLSRSSVELGKPKPVLPRAHEQYYTHLQSPGFSVRSAKSPLTLPSLLPPHPFSKIYPSPAVASLDCPPLLCVVIHISIFCVFDVLMGGRHAFLPLQAHSPIVLLPTWFSRSVLKALFSTSLPLILNFESRLFPSEVPKTCTCLSPANSTLSFSAWPCTVLCTHLF